MTGWVSTAALADRDPEWKFNLKQVLAQERWSPSLQTIVDKILDDQSLTTADGLLLFSDCEPAFILDAIDIIHSFE